MKGKLSGWAAPCLAFVIVTLMVWAIFAPVEFNSLRTITMNLGWKVVSLIGFLFGISLLAKGIWIHFHSPERRGEAQSHTIWGLLYAVVADIGIPELGSAMTGIAIGAWGAIQQVHVQLH